MVYGLKKVDGSKVVKKDFGLGKYYWILPS
jgi:hypothetical protein